MSVIIAGTGHRPDRLGGEYSYEGPVSSYIREKTRQHLVSRKPDQVISGMALGFDTILTLAAIDLKIPVLAAIPFEGQESKWPESSQRLYFKLLSNPLVEKWICAPGGWNNHKFDHRNRKMCDRATELLACFWGGAGGTWNTVRYAVEIGLPITRIPRYEPATPIQKKD